MKYGARVLGFDVRRLDVVASGKAVVTANERGEGGGYRYLLRLPRGDCFWVWRSSVNYYFLQSILSGRAIGFEGCPTLNRHLNNLVKTA